MSHRRKSKPKSKRPASRRRAAAREAKERHRIARDLHDSVAQCLVGIGMHLEWCHRHVDPDSPAYERLLAGKELARTGLG